MTRLFETQLSFFLSDPALETMRVQERWDVDAVFFFPQ